MLCNGVADCLHVEDEQSCVNYTCPGMLRCKGQSFCISQQEVCDRFVHCPQRDDETNCEICPEKCECLNQAVVCKNIDLSATHMLGILNMKLVSILQCSRAQTVLKHGVKLLFLIMNKDNIKYICQQSTGRLDRQYPLIVLDIASNHIETLVSNCFASYTMLKTISLKANRIHKISVNSLNKINRVLYIDLSSNRIVSLLGSIWSRTPSLRKLDLRGNPLLIFSGQILSRNLVDLLTDNYFVCCFTSSMTVNCSAKPVYLSSCKDLLSQLQMKMLIWIVGFFSFSINILNIVVRLMKNYERKILDYNTIAISLGDSLIGLYLLIIGIADSHFTGYFAGVQKYWQQSGWCKFAAGVYFYSTISSINELMTLSIFRSIAVTKPIFAQVSLLPKVGKILLLKGTVIILAITVTLVIYFSIYNKAPNFICLLVSMGESNNYLSGLTTLISGLQLFGLLFMIYTYSIISHSIGDDNFGNTILHETETPTTIKRKQKVLSRKIKLVVITNAICWTPQSIIFLIILAGYQVSADLITWLIITVMPINSIINGFAFSVGDERFRKYLRRERQALKKPVQSTNSLLTSQYDSSCNEK